MCIQRASPVLYPMQSWYVWWIINKSILCTMSEESFSLIMRTSYLLVSCVPQCTVSIHTKEAAKVRQPVNYSPPTLCNPLTGCEVNQVTTLDHRTRTVLYLRIHPPLPSWRSCHLQWRGYLTGLYLLTLLTKNSF